jgi:hypothetical protein
MVPLGVLLTIGLAALVGLIVLSAVSMFLPPLRFASPIIAIAIPAAFAAVACVTLIAAGVYMYVNRNKQVNDRYRLEFNRDYIDHSLYFDEDMDYVNQLLEPDNSSKAGVDMDDPAKTSSSQ